MWLMPIAIFGMLITLWLAWKLDRVFALKLLVLIVVVLVVVGLVVAEPEPIRNWWVPVI